MKTARWIVAGLLLLATTAFAEEWSLVAQDSDEIVFVDRTSIYEMGDLKKARVLRSFSKVQTIGDEAFPHKSEILLYAVRCEDRSLAFEQWTMTAWRNRHRRYGVGRPDRATLALQGSERPDVRQHDRFGLQRLSRSRSRPGFSLFRTAGIPEVRHAHLFFHLRSVFSRGDAPDSVRSTGAARSTGEATASCGDVAAGLRCSPL